MHSSPAPSTEPSPREFAAAVAHAERRGDPQAVIRLVEAWEREHTVALEPGLAQARAFLGLKLMDRAWVRLRELGHRHPGDPDVLALTAEVFVQRGWPARARKVLDQLRVVDPSHEALASLAHRAAQPPAGPPPDAREIERRGDPAALVALAEAYLSTGSFLRARSILERVRRSGAGDRRVELLLWGLQGDFVPRGVAIADLMADLGVTGGWEIVDHTDAVRAADLGAADPPTAEVTRSVLVAAGMLEPPGDDRFPSLFRRVQDGPLPRDDDDEVTMSSGMASTEELRDAPVEERTDPGAAGGGDLDGDTRIMQVIPGPGGAGLSEAAGPIHEELAEATAGGLRETLDLRAWQESMGMGSGAVEDEDFLEAEDEDLVVMTRREEAAGEPDVPPAPREGPIEVVEKHPVPDPPPAEPRVEPPPAESEDEAVARMVESARPARRWGRIIAAIVAMTLAMGGATVLSLRYLHDVVASRQFDEVDRALAAGDYRGLLEMEARLSMLVAAGSEPLEARAAALAQVESVLWGEYTGNPDQHERALAALEQARRAGVDPRRLALAEGTLALQEGDLRRAARSASVAGIETEAGRFLAASVALARGDPAAGLTLWQAGDADDAVGVRHRLLREALLRATGDDAAADAEARSLLDSAGDNPLVAVAGALRGWGGGGTAERIAAIDTLLDTRRDELAPRQLALLYGARADLLERNGQPAAALDSWRRAASVDATWAPALARLAAVSLGKGRVLDALKDLEICVAHNPADEPCLRGQVQALIELDRLVEASNALASSLVVGRPVQRLEAWVAVQDGRAGAVLPDLVDLAEAEGAEGEPLTLYLLGAALAGEGGDPAKAERALERAQQLLEAKKDPYDRLLGGRIAGALVELAAKGDVRSRVREALAIAAGDPWVHISVGRRYEALGRHRSAREHLREATRLGPECALAWYELGQLQFAPSTMSDALAAWRRYLELAPSGDRAERVARRLR